MPARSALVFSCVLAGLASSAGCQQPRGDVIDRLLIGEVMMHSEFAANLRTLAMPGGRLSGTPNAARAQQFVVDKLRAYGLWNVHEEPFEMECWIVHETTVTLLTDPPRVLDGAVALGQTISTPPGGITAELIDLDEPKEEDFAARAAELAGQLVLTRDGGLRRSRKLSLALEHGALGLVVMSRPERLPIIGNGHHEPRPEPAVTIPYDEDLLARLAAGETLRLNIQYETENWPCRPSNVVGQIPGRGPLADEVVILSAHLDSWHLGEGAIDNGNGSAAILETVRALAGVGWQPRRTVRFIWFMGEELGLEGSWAYVRQHEDELDDIVAVVNVDMPGSPRSLVVFGHPELEPFLERLRCDLAGYELTQRLSSSTGMGSDHGPFLRQGVCTLALSGDIGPGGRHYHTAGDVYDTVDRRGTIPSSAVLAVLIRRLADEPRRPSVRLEPPATEP